MTKKVVMGVALTVFFAGGFWYAFNNENPIIGPIAASVSAIALIVTIVDGVLMFGGNTRAS